MPASLLYLDKYNSSRFEVFDKNSSPGSVVSRTEPVHRILAKKARGVVAAKVYPTPSAKEQYTRLEPSPYNMTKVCACWIRTLRPAQWLAGPNPCTVLFSYFLSNPYLEHPKILAHIHLL